MLRKASNPASPATRTNATSAHESVAYDVVVASPLPHYRFFSRRMMQFCGQMGLTYFFIDDLWIEQFTRKLERREVAVRVLVDLAGVRSDPWDPYARLAREVKRQGGYLMDEPERTAAATHKARFHDVLLRHRIPLPETIVVRRDELDTFRVTDEVAAKVGVPFVVKPAWGNAGAGVLVDATSEEDVRRSAAAAPRADAFLVQRQVAPRQLGDHVGWFRAYYACGQVIACWWDRARLEYRMVTPREVSRYKLQPLAKIVRGIADAAGMKKFSAEICLDEDGRFYAVDQLNPAPDMNPRSFYHNGIPDQVVGRVVWLLFMDALRVVKRRQGFFDRTLLGTAADWLQRRRLEQQMVA